MHDTLPSVPIATADTTHAESAAAASLATNLPTRQQIIGPFVWRDRQVRCVLTKAWAGQDTTVAALRLIDASDTVLYQESFDVAAGARGLEEQLGVVPVLLEASDAVALMLDMVSEPSAPMGGSSRKILAWKDGRVQPVSPALRVYGEFVSLLKGEHANSIRLLPGNIMPVRVWAYSFAVQVSLEIRLAAFAAGDSMPLGPVVQIDTSSGLPILPVSDLVLSRVADRADSQAVMLYRAATGSAGERVQVRRTSQIRYGPAYGWVRLDRDAHGRWVDIDVHVARLRVTIDDKTGFVEESDFAAVGLSSAG